MPDRELMDAQAEALFVHDEDGRIVRTNEPGGTSAPRFFLGRTCDGNVWRLRNDLPARLAREMAATASKEPVTTDLRSAPVYYERYCDLLRVQREIRSIYAGPAYVFPAEITLPGKVVRIRAANSVLLQRGFGAAAAEQFEARAPCVAVVEEGMAVSICFCSRITPRVAEAGVETLEPYRRRGFAARAVAGWALAVQARGRLPLYSTSWENRASQAVAEKLGLRLYGVDLSIR